MIEPYDWIKDDDGDVLPLYRPEKIERGLVQCRREALENAAVVCDEQAAIYALKLDRFTVAEYERIERTEAYKEAVERMAEAIRALKEKS